MKIVFPFICLFLFIAVRVDAQSQLFIGGGITGSVNMGEAGPAPILKSNFVTGDKFKFENNFELSSMDKYTKAGWFVADGVNFLVFPSEKGFFVSGAIDYRHRNGGQWAKDGVRVGGGVGYEKENAQIRFTVKEKVISLNDNIEYFPYFEFLVRGDTPFNDSWSLRTEVNLGTFRYIQNNHKSTAFYLNTVLGLVYRWP